MGANELKDLFRRYGTSHAQIARRLGCSVSNVNALLNGYRSLSSNNMRQLQAIKEEVLRKQAESLSQDIRRFAPNLSGRFGEIGVGR